MQEVTGSIPVISTRKKKHYTEMCGAFLFAATHYLKRFRFLRYPGGRFRRVQPLHVVCSAVAARPGVARTGACKGQQGVAEGR